MVVLPITFESQSTQRMKLHTWAKTAAKAQLFKALWDLMVSFACMKWSYNPGTKC